MNQAKMSFIEISTTSVTKQLKMSETVIDFGHVVVGTRETKSIKISSNIDKEQQLCRDQTSALSGFSVVNCLRKIGVNKPFDLVLEFTPY